MDKLERFFEDVHTIREILESKERVSREVGNGLNPIASEPVASTITPPAPITTVAPQPVTPIAPVAPTQPVNVIPTTAQAESFTQDQIAVAMSNAMTANRKDVVDKILATFNAQCLMQIDPTNYNQIAVMLREAGVQV